MKDAMPGHQYLQIGRYHRNQGDAEKFVLDWLGARNPGVPRNDWRRKTITVTTSGGERSDYTFPQLVRLARESGDLGPLHGRDDQQDRFFGGRFGMSTSSEALSIRADYAGVQASYPGPACDMMVEVELTNDIALYRRRICDNSFHNALGFAEIARDYRAYVFACTALVESFLNHHLTVAKFEGRDVSAVESIQNFEVRLDAWLAIFAAGAVGDLKGTEAWCHLKELRTVRNSLIHGASPAFGLSLREVPRVLNHARTGVGGFLGLLRDKQGLPRPGFVVRLQTLPKVRFVSRSRS